MAVYGLDSKKLGRTLVTLSDFSSFCERSRRRQMENDTESSLRITCATCSPTTSCISARLVATASVMLARSVKCPGGRKTWTCFRSFRAANCRTPVGLRIAISEAAHLPCANSLNISGAGIDVKILRGNTSGGLTLQVANRASRQQRGQVSSRRICPAVAVCGQSKHPQTRSTLCEGPCRSS